jgi:ubiquinone/menaquinone biosynthesis C-methylase UbiE
LSSAHLDDIYAERFDDADAARKEELWREIARFLQRYIPATGAVLDLACDRGTFIRNIAAREKWATDVRDVRRHLPPEVHFVQCDGLRLDQEVPGDHFDAVFMSNYLEHLASSESVIDQLQVVRRVLKRGGRAVVLQPNIRLVGGRYWDFIDHKVALTEKSLAEAAALAGLETQVVLTRFLPYTTKSRIPQNAALVRLYLRLRPAWWLMGKQTLYIAVKP